MQEESSSDTNPLTVDTKIKTVRRLKRKEEKQLSGRSPNEASQARLTRWVASWLVVMATHQAPWRSGSVEVAEQAG